ncbi:hypothetical protein E2C01_021083 [Portunus trituberculatus]|uniref:Uncharacterized protein n=1 Tax=Portunus trituberculatus TaxID=210409 RepID=A0A5B7E544_PORTR|nr:hypothetical protein [Portunus trituberculatus]
MCITGAGSLTSQFIFNQQTGIYDMIKRCRQHVLFRPHQEQEKLQVRCYGQEGDTGGLFEELCE